MAFSSKTAGPEDSELAPTEQEKQRARDIAALEEVERNWNRNNIYDPKNPTSRDTWYGRQIERENNSGVLDVRGGKFGFSDSTVSISTEAVDGKGTSKREISDPPGTRRNSNGRLIDENTGKFVRDPSVIDEKTTSEKLRRAQQSDFNSIKDEILERDQMCQFCQKNEASQVDHFRSIKSFADEVDAGIRTLEEAAKEVVREENLVGACGGTGGCNQIKGAKPVSLGGQDTKTFSPIDPTKRVVDLINKD